ncbi:MAG: acyltransferase [Candidatus Azambacteria bacterium]|nr:acyltransferase [Candidatus Azambacteria bacterium]
MIRPKPFRRHGAFLLLYSLVKYLPSPLGDRFRYFIAKPFLKKMGKSVIAEGVSLWYPYGISIGDNVKLNEGVYLSGYGGIEIEDEVRIGLRSVILSSDHEFDNRNEPIFRQKLKVEKVKICQDAFIGCNVTILKGVTIGKGSVVGAGAVVTKDVAEYTIVAGVPAKKIGKRK